MLQVITDFLAAASWTSIEVCCPAPESGKKFNRKRRKASQLLLNPSSAHLTPSKKRNGRRFIEYLCLYLFCLSLADSPTVNTKRKYRHEWKYRRVRNLWSIQRFNSTWGLGWIALCTRLGLIRFTRTRIVVGRLSVLFRARPLT